jgi:DHA2 family multidrug resistance protein
VRLVVFGIAAYAMNSELSQNVAASLEGWYADHWSWHWIYWQYCAALPFMAASIWFGVPREPINAALLRYFDWPGVVYASIGFAMLYAGFDQGNRLDWAGSGLVVGLIAGGGMLVSAFLAREVVAPRPFLNLGLLMRGNLALMLVILSAIRFIVLSTGYIVPAYLQAVQSFRELQVGQVLLWIALPQFVIVVPLALLLRRLDGRVVLAFGVVLVGAACLMAAQITSVWSTPDFLPSQILQAVGQSFALTALTMLLIRSIIPVEALTVGCLLQLSRLFGGELGTAFMQTFVRRREQFHSNIIGQSVTGESAIAASRISTNAARLVKHGVDAAALSTQPYRVLAASVISQANVLAYQDGFIAAAVGAGVCLLLVALLRPERPSLF